MSDVEGEPVRFIRQVKDKASILVLYEDVSYARSLEFLFLRQGLDMGQNVAYLSPQSAQNSEKLMSLFGIEPRHFKGRLDIISTVSKKREHIIKAMEEFAEKCDCPIRIILQNDGFVPDQYGDILFIENSLTSQFEQNDISVMVSYNAEFLSDAKIMQQIINLHDYVIFAPTFGKGMVVKTK